MCRITTDQFLEWAEARVSIFKYEKVSTYYVPCNIKLKRLANGKLWDKYNNLKKYIKNNEIVLEKENIELNVDQEALLKLRAIQPNDSNLNTF